jgi:hypothetical protein
MEAYDSLLLRAIETEETKKKPLHHGFDAAAVRTDEAAKGRGMHSWGI